MVFPMSENGGLEELWDEIPALARLFVGSEHLTLYLTSGRILVAHGLKSGSGTLVASSAFGSLGGLVRGLRRRKSPPKNVVPEGFNAKIILGAHKDNFSVTYAEVVSVVVTEPDDPSALTGITMVTGRDKIEFFSRLSVRRLAESFAKGLGGKVRVQRSQRLPHS